MEQVMDVLICSTKIGEDNSGAGLKPSCLRILASRWLEYAARQQFFDPQFQMAWKFFRAVSICPEKRTIFCYAREGSFAVVFVNDFVRLTYHKSRTFSILLIHFLSINGQLTAATWCET
jgi:hypothetical protein